MAPEDAADVKGKCLTEVPLKRTFRSDEDDLVGDFYVPCLSRSVTYSRAVGFFSSTALSASAKGLHEFIRTGGRMRLIASPHLSKEDVDQIVLGYRSRQEVIEKALVRALEEEIDGVIRDRLGFLAWLIQRGVLDIQIAICKNLSRQGIYHEKVGIFEDSDSHYVAFTGSPNESSSGLISNFEAIDVFPSWSDKVRDYAEDKKRNFERLWRKDTQALEVYPFPEAAKAGLLRFRQNVLPSQDPEAGPIRVYQDEPGIPKKKELRGYQNEAIRNWFAANGQGIFKMATGSGKTITALGLATKLYEKAHVRTFIVVCPYKHLVTQWAREAKEFNFKPVLCFESRNQWEPLLRTELLRAATGGGAPVMAITTNNTFAGDAFQSLLQQFPKNTLLIADEMHNLGADQLQRCLPPQITFRLGLAATPERYFDDTGTASLYAYFGQVVQPEFTLKMAMEAKALVPYRYFPITVELTGEEAEEYNKLSLQIAQAIGARKKDADLSDVPDFLAIKRARLLAKAENKLLALRNLMAGRRGDSHLLFYCGDGSVDVPGHETEIRHVEAVCRVLGIDLGMRVQAYIADTPLDEREDLRVRFRSGELQGLVAIRCLDEGVDIPEIRSAVILASSSNPRQFIQRRGRILRTCIGKSQAEIFDMIVVPPSEREGHSDAFNTERRLLKKELNRFIEFAELATNGPQAKQVLLPLLDKYRLLDL